MSQKSKRTPKTRSSIIYCQEKFSCQGENVEAVYECEDCGTKQCLTCKTKLHEVAKFRAHEIKQLATVSLDLLCQYQCRKKNYADLKCIDCELNLCFECFNVMHKSVKKSGHKKVPFVNVPKGESENDTMSEQIDLRTDHHVPALKPLSPFGLGSTLPDDSLTYFSMPQKQEPVVNEITSFSREGSREKMPAVKQPFSENLKAQTAHKSSSVDSNAAMINTVPEINVVNKKLLNTSVMDDILDEIDDDKSDSLKSIPLNGNGGEKVLGIQSFLLADENENLKITDEEEFVNLLQCSENTRTKVVSIFGNTGDGKSHTLNHTFFNGLEVFKTSASPDSCTVGVWAAFDPVHSAIIIDTEGLLGVSVNQNQRTRLLLKVMAISDIVIYRTRADRLHNDLYQFLGDASKAFQRHFSEELKSASERCKFDFPLSTLCPTVIIFHETQHTDVLGKGNPAEAPDMFLRKRFRDMNLSVEFNSLAYIGTRTITPPTNFKPLLRKIKEQIHDNSVRSPRRPGIVLQMLKVLNDKFSGDIEKSVPSTFPDQYFTCSSTCLSCNSRCTRTMNHIQDGIPHEADNRCRFQHQHDNRVYTCKSCYERIGKEVMVIPKTCSSKDNQWFGLAKYAWSGYVLECPNCGVIYRSRQHWYGNEDPVKSVARTEIKHVWPDGNPVLQGTHNAARRVIDGLHYLGETMSKIGAKPAKFVGNWVTDQIAPSYWVPNASIKACHKCRTALDGSEQIHHCRACGQGFCDDCTQHKKPVPERGWGDEPVRVCDLCFNSTTSMADSRDSDSDTQVRARIVGEVITNAIGTVASAIDYPLDVIKDSSRPTYWVPDNEITMCAVCQTPFGPKLKIHHCRACGNGVCDPCSPDRKPVQSRGWDHPVRVCRTCIKKNNL